uniref:Uncharacterized protein n=1 Tax=Meloidogyne floridensis TaxID=298350 RepID=A0A915PDK7_9BILA
MTYYSIKIICCLFLSITLFKLTNQCMPHTAHCDNSTTRSGCCKGPDYCLHNPTGCGYECSDNSKCIKEGNKCDYLKDGCCYGMKCVAYLKACKKCSFNKCKTTDDCCIGHCANGKCYKYTDC